MASQLLLKQEDWSSLSWLTGWLRGLSTKNGSRPKKSAKNRSGQIELGGGSMKKYIKPSIKALGLLRVVTQFSRGGDCPVGVLWKVE